MPSRKTVTKGFEACGRLWPATKQEAILLKTNNYVLPKNNYIILITSSTVKAGLKWLGVDPILFAPIVPFPELPAQQLFQPPPLLSLMEAEHRPAQLPPCCMIDESWKRRQYGLDADLKNLRNRYVTLYGIRPAFVRYTKSPVHLCGPWPVASGVLQPPSDLARNPTSCLGYMGVVLAAIH